MKPPFETHFDVLIIGAGAAGMSAARWCHSLRMSYALFESAAVMGGQLRFANHVISDYLGVENRRGEALASAMQTHVVGQGAPSIYLNCPVTHIDAHQGWVETPQGRFYGRTLLLAMGARPKLPDVPGAELFLDHPLRMGLPLDVAAGERVIVLGGGDSAADAALTAAERGAQVSMLLRGQKFRVQRHRYEAMVGHPLIEILYNVTLQRLERHQVTFHTTHSEERTAEHILIRMGWTPNSEAVAGQLACDAQGYIQTAKNGTTALPHVAAIGDVANPPDYSSIVASVGQAMWAMKALYATLGRE